MKWIIKLLKIFQLFLISIISLVAIDTFILGGKMKLWFIAVANTTSASPFSTDGQMNFIFIFFGIIVALCNQLMRNLN